MRWYQTVLEHRVRFGCCAARMRCASGRSGAGLPTAHEWARLSRLNVVGAAVHPSTWPTFGRHLMSLSALSTLQLSRCDGLTDSALSLLLPSCARTLRRLLLEQLLLELLLCPCL